MNFYRCEGCGKIVAVVKPSKCPTKCCGEPMAEMIPNSTDASKEKHIPVIAQEGNLVKVTVGASEHTMTEEHYIEWILLETKEGRQRKPLAPGQKAEACFALTEGDEVVAAYEYCNLHGFWKAEA